MTANWFPLDALWQRGEHDGQQHSHEANKSEAQWAGSEWAEEAMALEQEAMRAAGWHPLPVRSPAGGEMVDCGGSGAGVGLSACLPLPLLASVLASACLS